MFGNAAKNDAGRNFEKPLPEIRKLSNPQIGGVQYDD
jgi:hypothetical protein